MSDDEQVDVEVIGTVSTEMCYRVRTRVNGRPPVLSGQYRDHADAKKFYDRVRQVENVVDAALIEEKVTTLGKVIERSRK